MEEEKATTSREAYESNPAKRENVSMNEEYSQLQAAANTGAKPKSLKPKFNMSEKLGCVPECLKRILNGVQTEFMGNLSEDQKSKYRYIKMVQNYEGKEEVPKMLQEKAVSDFKENVRKTVEKSLLDSLELDTISTTNAADSLNRKEIYNETEQYMNKKLEELFAFVNASTCDVNKEIEENMKSEQTEIMKQDYDQKQTISEQYSQLANANLKFRILENKHKKLETSLEQSEKVTKQEEMRNARIHTILEDRKTKLQTLNKKLSKKEIQLNHCKMEEQKTAEIYNEREAQLVEVKNKLEDAANEREKLHKEISRLENAAREDEKVKRKSELELNNLIQQFGNVEELQTKLLEMEEKNRIMEHRLTQKKLQEEEEMKAKMSAAVTKIMDLSKKQREVETECMNITDIRQQADREDVRNFLEAQVEYFRRKEIIKALEDEEKQDDILRVKQAEEIHKLEAELRALIKKKE